MANKAVVGLAAMGVSAYAINEQLQDWRARKERERIQRQRQDNIDALQMRIEGVQRKKKGGRDGFADVLHEMQFTKGVWSRVEDILYDLVLKVGENAKPLRNSNRAFLNLPLMSTEYGKEDIMLATALALGYDNLVLRIIELYDKHQLGIGLNKFTPDSIIEINRTLESIDEPPVAKDCLSLFVSLGVYDPDFISGIPKVFCYKCGDEYHESDNLFRYAKEFGFHVTFLSAFKVDVQVQRSRPRVTFTLNRNAKYQGKGDRMMISNFLCNFSTPLRLDNMQPDFSEIVLLTSTRHQVRMPKTDVLADFFARKIASSMAKVAAKRLSTLARQCDDSHGVSLQHIAVHSGYRDDDLDVDHDDENAEPSSRDILKMLEDTDLTIITNNSDKIMSTMSTSLESTILPPENNDGGQDSPVDMLRGEISSFIASYFHLITLTYQEIPRVNGKPPSHFVPNSTVASESLDGTCWCRRPMAVHSIRRVLMKGERERVKRSRMLVTPGVEYSLVLVGLTWLILAWLSYFAIELLLRLLSSPVHSIAYPLVLGQAFAFWTMYALVGIFKTVFQLNNTCSSWEVVVCCAEYIHRTIAVMRGRPTLYEQEMKRLKEKCDSQYRIWKMRSAKKCFDEALKRKWITSGECVLLLTEFAHKFVEVNGVEVVEGVLPVSLADAEKFLQLRVEEPMPSNEASVHKYLSRRRRRHQPRQKKRKYLQFRQSEQRGAGNMPCAAASDDDDDDAGFDSYDEDSGEYAHERNSLELLHDFNDMIQNVFEFSKGDRVIVDVEGINGDEDTSTEQVCSSLVLRRSRTASVVFMTATLCFVHFDGEPATSPIPVPVNRCSLIQENYKDDRSSPKGIADTRSEDASVESSDDDDISDIASQAPRALTVEEALVSGGWKLVRTKNHIRYSRFVKVRDGVKKESLTLAKTSSDWRAKRNALALIRRLNNNSCVAHQSNEETSTVFCSTCKRNEVSISFLQNSTQER